MPPEPLTMRANICARFDDVETVTLYDPAGNRTLKNEDGARTTYSYDAANQLKTAIDGSGTTTFVFDADGNQERVIAPNGDRTTTSWDYENRTTLVELPSGIRNTMAYEPGGLRVKLEESTGTKKFVWDEQNYLAETDENDNTQVVYTNEPRVYGNLVSQRRGMDSHWYHFDAIGSTRELTDDSEAVTDTRLYDAWGVALAVVGSRAPNSGYVGELGYFWDIARGTYLIRMRHLVSALAQWTSPDPLGVLFQRHALSRYTYVANRPVVHVDPSGLVEMTRRDPHTGDVMTLEASVCRNRTERDREHREKPLPETSCPFEYCTAFVAEAWDSPRVRECRNYLRQYADNTYQGHRCGDVAESPPPCDPNCQYLGLYRPATHEIVVCMNSVVSNNSPFDLSALETTLCHELLHARQSRVCRPISPYNTGDRCQDSMRRELQAYYCANGCDWFWGCLRRVLRSSCPGACNPDPPHSEPTQQQIDELYEWANRFVADGRFCPSTGSDPVNRVPPFGGGAPPWMDYPIPF